MTTISAGGFDVHEFREVLEYVREHCNPRWRRAIIERMDDARGDFFLVLLSDKSTLETSREVVIWNIEYDPQGAGRGFRLDPETNRYTKDNGTPLLTTVYTRWAIERRRRRPNDRTNNGIIVDDATWESGIVEIIDEIRESHEGARFSMHVPIPSVYPP